MKKLLSKIKDNYKNYLKNHLGTNIMLIITTILVLFINFEKENITLEKLLVTSCSMTLFACLVELFTKEKEKRYLFYAISLALSLIMSFTLLPDNYRYIIGIILIAASITLYLFINNSKVTTDKYATRAFTNLLKMCIIGAIINMGAMLIFGLISMLLVDLDYNIMMKIELIIFLLYYVPASIISLESIEKHESKFIHSLNNYVLLPLVSTASIIIYIYLIKLIVTLELPDTSIFGIITALMVFSLPTILMVLSYEDNSIFTKIANILKYLFIPLILLQIYALGVRIIDYSLTDMRYLGIIVIIIEILTLISLIKRNGKDLKHIISPVVMILIIAFIIPYINMIDFPNHMQIKRLETIITKDKDLDTLTGDEIREIRSIYYYVTDEKYYPDYISRKELSQKLNLFYDDGSDEIMISLDFDKLDISDYKSIEFVETSNFNSLDINIRGNKYNVSELYNQIIKEYEEDPDKAEEYVSNNRIIHINDEIDFYIIWIHLTYPDVQVSLDGYILYK